jgi:hypothetical protein
VSLATQERRTERREGYGHEIAIPERVREQWAAEIAAEGGEADVQVAKAEALIAKIEAARVGLDTASVEVAYTTYFSALEAVVVAHGTLAHLLPLQKRAHRILSEAGVIDTPFPEPMSVRSMRDRETKQLREQACLSVLGDI